MGRIPILESSHLCTQSPPNTHRLTMYIGICILSWVGQPKWRRLLFDLLMTRPCWRTWGPFFQIDWIIIDLKSKEAKTLIKGGACVFDQIKTFLGSRKRIFSRPKLIRFSFFWPSCSRARIQMAVGYRLALITKPGHKNKRVKAPFQDALINLDNRLK